MDRESDLEHGFCQSGDRGGGRGGSGGRRGGGTIDVQLRAEADAVRAVPERDVDAARHVLQPAEGGGGEREGLPLRRVQEPRPPPFLGRQFHSGRRPRQVLRRQRRRQHNLLRYTHARWISALSPCSPNEGKHKIVPSLFESCQ